MTQSLKRKRYASLHDNTITVMASNTLNKLRAKYPKLENVSDEVLTVQIGNKYPQWLEADEQFKSDYDNLTSTTIGGMASQMAAGFGRALPAVGKAGWGAVEGLSAPSEKIGGNSVFDVITGGLGSKIAANYLGSVFPDMGDISDGINEMAGEMVDQADLEIERRIKGGEITGLLGGTSYTPGSASEFPTFAEETAGVISEASGSVLVSGLSGMGAVGKVAGTRAALASGVQVFGGTYADAKRRYEAEGDPQAKEKAFGIAFTDGLKTTALTKGFSTFAVNRGIADVDTFFSVLKRDPVARRTLVDYVKTVIPGAAVEAIEEGLDEGLSTSLAKYSYAPETTLGDILKTTAQGALAGFFLSGTIETGSFAGSQYNLRKKAKMIRETSPETADRLIKIAEEQAKNNAEAKSKFTVGTDAEGNPVPMVIKEDQPEAETTEDKDAETLRLEQESIPSPMTVSSVDTSEEDLDVAQQQQLIDTPELTNDEIDELAQAQAIDDLGLVPIRPTDPKLAEQIPNFDTAQKDVYEETYKFYKDAYKQYQDKPNDWLKETGRQPEPTPEPEPVATPCLLYTSPSPRD